MIGSNALILLVDDDENMCQFISLALQELGEVACAYDGEEALKRKPRGRIVKGNNRLFI